MFSPSLEKLHWQILNSKDVISLSEDETSNFDPLMVFTFYFFDDKVETKTAKF
jgi:hypothetical protein